MIRTRKFNGELFSPSQDFESKYSAERHKEKMKRLGYKVRIIKEKDRWNNDNYIVWVNSVHWTLYPYHKGRGKK